MATGGRSRQQYVLTDVKDAYSFPSTYSLSTASPGQQMHRSHHYADSLYFIQKRYEDTSLVIFHQHSKAKRKESKAADQHPQWSAVVQNPPPHHLQLPPGVGFDPNINPASVDESHLGAASSVPSTPRLPASPGGRSSNSADWSGKGSATFVSEAEKSDVASSPGNRSRLGSDSSAEPSSVPHRNQGTPPPPSSPNQSPADLAGGYDTTATNGRVPVSEPDSVGDVAAGNSSDLRRRNGNATYYPSSAGSVGSTPQTDEQHSPGSGVSAARHSGSGAVPRRRVGMSKTDSVRLQSRVCAVM